MKQFLTLLLIIGLGIGIMNLDVAKASTTVENRISTDYIPKEPATEMELTYIDDVAVPYSVLVYAQVVYQGYAITQAEEIIINGEKVYKLRIDNDSNPNDNDGLYLIYNMEWKLIDKHSLYSPAPSPPKPEVKEEADEAPTPELEPDTTTEEESTEDTNTTIEDTDESIQETEETNDTDDTDNIPEETSEALTAEDETLQRRESAETQ